MYEYLTGLTTREVEERRMRGEGGAPQARITKSRGKIIGDNLFTLFNFLNFLIAALLFAVGAYSNMLFIAIIILNIVIGIAQELKAKKLVDELSILNRPSVRVRRNEKEVSIALEEIVKDDLMILSGGDQIVNDGVIAAGELEVNESLLTGESDAIIKNVNDALFSGSFVISGKALARVTHVGNENYAAKLANEVRREKKVQSELLGSMKKVTRFTSFLIIPLGILLFLEAFFLRQAPADTAVVSSAAALLGMLPKGLVLLISVSLAAGVIRLAKMKILVQNIYSLETLAHVDTLCLDKTGTITDGNLTVSRVIPMAEQKAHFQPRDVYRPVHKIPFSSKRKWGCVSFEDAGSIFIGAPEILMGVLPQNLAYEMDHGRRVVVIAYSGRLWDNSFKLPPDLYPLYGVALEDHIRQGAAQTLEFFDKEGVDVKVISGDHMKTVSMIARRAGLHRWKNAVDMSLQGELPDYDQLCRDYAIFARVTPGQKQELVKALKRQGHQVAMTGDGVNDLLALREADCSIAVADGSDASRQISQVFFIKTIYSVLVSLFCLLTNQAFPFIPIQITLVDACIEAWPSFLTILESNTSRIRRRFLPAAISGAAPFGVAVTVMIMIMSLAQPFPQPQLQTVMYLMLVVISMTAVVKSCWPMNPLRIFICVTMIGGTFFALAILPSLFEISAVTGPMLAATCAGSALSLLAVIVLWGVRCYILQRRSEKGDE